MSALDDQFLDSLALLAKPYPRFTWHLSAIVALGAMNYPEEIPSLYTRLLKYHIPEEEHLGTTRKIREALTKLSGIQGAAKTGSALRALATATPEKLLDPVNYREHDSDEIAFARGRIFFEKIYGPNKQYDQAKTAQASPDYFDIVTNYFYGRIFSFDKILGMLETEQAVITALIGIDCQEQVTNHMKGMQYNGASKAEVEMIREIAVRIALKLGIKLKSVPLPVPDI